MKLTRSHTYLLPIFNNYVEILQPLILNTYLGVKNINTTFDETIYCHFKFDSDNLSYEKYLFNHKLFYKHINLKDNTYILGFYFPKEEIETMYSNFINGKYSKFPNKHKLTILNFHKLNSQSLQAKIMFKDKLLYQEMSNKLNCEIPYTQEIGEIPTFESECFYNINYEIKES